MSTVFTFYEIVTHSEEFQEHDAGGQYESDVLDLEDWDNKAKLDTDLGSKHLTDWMQWRAGMHRVSRDQRLHIPDMPPTSQVVVDLNKAGKPTYGNPIAKKRVEALKFKQSVCLGSAPDTTRCTPMVLGSN